MKSKSTIIYVAPSLPSFVRNDIRALSEKYRVVTNTYNWKKKQFAPFYLLHQLFFFLFSAPGAKAIIISFGGLWSVIPTFIGKLFNTPSFIILNGTDAASIPPLNYGSLRKKRIRSACEVSYQNCNLLLPVSESLVRIRNTFYSDDEFSHQGFRHFFPNLKTPHQTVHNGLDTAFWKMPENIKIEPGRFITVFNPQQFILKGGDLIVEMARRFPDLNFTIAGCNQPDDLPTCPENLKFMGRLKPEELREAYSRAQFHFQLSIFEGFGVSLCEAMLCECIPIVSSVNMLPEIIGDTGYILKKRDAHALEQLIKKAINPEIPMKQGKLARERIKENYSTEIRKKNLFKIIDDH